MLRVAMLLGTLVCTDGIFRQLAPVDWNPFDVIRSIRSGVHMVEGELGPFALVTEGCDGSTAIMRHAHKILLKHGIVTPEMKSREVLSKDRNEFVQPGDTSADVPRRMIEMKTYYEKKNKTLMFKGIIGRDQDAILSRSLYDMNTVFIENSRKNMLDQVVCMIKDCFDKHLGYPVLNGKKSDLCMKRRNADPGDGYMAYIDTTMLGKGLPKVVDNVKRFDEHVRATVSDLEKIGYTVQKTWTEDLLDFQWNREAMKSSVDAWAKLLEAWKIKPIRSDIEAYLEESVGTREAPSLHKNVIYNFEELKMALEDYPELKKDIRG